MRPSGALEKQKKIGLYLPVISLRTKRLTLWRLTGSPRQ